MAKAVKLTMLEQLTAFLQDGAIGNDDVYIGIDPGVTGAIALLQVSDKKRMRMAVFDIPTITVDRLASAGMIKARKKLAKKKKQKKAVSRTTTRSEYDFQQLADFFVKIRKLTKPQRVHILVEKVVVSTYRPGARRCMACKRQFGQSPYTGVAVGIANGMWPMLFYAYAWKDFTYVDSGKWKPRMGLAKKDKSASRAVASALFKRYNHYFARVKDHNRAEAALIAAYACRFKTEVFSELHVSVGSEAE